MAKQKPEVESVATLMTRTETFVRDVLVNVFHQEASDAVVIAIASKIVKKLPKRVKKESKRSMEQHLSSMAAPQR